jgi:AcrR family transcriptional regulator
VSERSEQRRAEIVEAALDLFTERGYHDTGVADIAARLHMSHGTFYRYFESKRDILDHLVEEAGARIADALGREAPPGSANTVAAYRTQVAAIAGRLLSVVREDPRFVRLLLFEATGVDAAMTDKVMALLDRYRSITAAYLEHGIAAGYLPADLDALETARALNGILFAGALGVLRGGEELDAFGAATLRLMFGGIAGSAAASVI